MCSSYTNYLPGMYTTRCPVLGNQTYYSGSKTKSFSASKQGSHQGRIIDYLFLSNGHKPMCAKVRGARSVTIQPMLAYAKKRAVMSTSQGCPLALKGRARISCACRGELTRLSHQQRQEQMHRFCI